MGIVVAGDVVESVAGGVWVKCRSVFVDYPLRYGLRRLVW